MGTLPIIREREYPFFVCLSGLNVGDFVFSTKHGVGRIVTIIPKTKLGIITTYDVEFTANIISYNVWGIPLDATNLLDETDRLYRSKDQWYEHQSRNRYISE